jgi:hypothetical protein
MTGDSPVRAGITVAEAAELLGLTPQAVRNRGYSVPGSGHRPALVDRDEVARDFAIAVRRLESDLKRMKAVASKLSIAVEDDGPTFTGHLSGDARDEKIALLEKLVALHEAREAVSEELASERSGRVGAELRIDQLKNDLRRANSTTDILLEAVRASKPDPDPNLDRIA